MRSNYYRTHGSYLNRMPTSTGFNSKIVSSSAKGLSLKHIHKQAPISRGLIAYHFIHASNILTGMIVFFLLHNIFLRLQSP